ncbi:hypothetical protein FLGE108171_10105 [Flavobacterium gelidilacus]|uniref:hypothetical protein n=1 Tax=Flavobacterium gelidilacus TaxID=206041 RepID=UPI000412BA67|nr:hypothetical protein [Flavobacterium gelidilacus]
MIKNVMKYLFSFYIILFIGTSSLFANSKDANNDLNPTEKNTSEISNDNLFLNFQTVHAAFEKENNKIRATDNELTEEEESISEKREIVSSTFFSSVLYAEQLGYLCNNIKKRVFHNQFFENKLSNKFQIVFCVFRI